MIPPDNFFPILIHWEILWHFNFSINPSFNTESLGFHQKNNLKTLVIVPCSFIYNTEE